MKRCTKCGVEQPQSEFYAAKGTRDGLRGDCKACFRRRAAERYRRNPEPTKQRVRRWALENPEKRAAWQRKYRASGRRQQNDRRSYLKRRHNLTPEEYEAMLAAQGGVCAICGRPPTDGISLHVDHDHKTGAIRAIACFRCNNGIGDFGDDPALLERAAAYLLEHDPEMQRLGDLARARFEALKPAS